MKKINVHFMGIKGVGMTPLAIISKEAGWNVTGCDIPDEFITDEPLRNAGISVFGEFSKEHVQGIDLLIATGAHGGWDNIEVKAAKEKGIEVLMQGEALGKFMEGTLLGRKFEGISVAGTHGKTTTTAMIATLLTEGKEDPSFVVGTSNLLPLGAPGHLGKGKWFIAEADEYVIEPTYNKKAKFLYHHPKIAVITNIEHDHPDMYPTLESLFQAFREFVSLVPLDGAVILCGDDHENQKLLQGVDKRVITYGFNPSNDYVVTRVSPSEEKTFFRVESKGADLGEFRISVTGDHNVLNSVAAIIVALEVGLSLEKIKQVLPVFRGSKRRMEYKGQLSSGAYVYDDYAHHPTEIMKTLSGLRKKYPRKKIITVFQPHTYSRTKKLFEQFSRSFSEADTVIFMDIYASQREPLDPSVTSELLRRETSKWHKDTMFLPTQQDVVEYLDPKNLREDTVLITMGAGDVYKIGEVLLKKAQLTE